MTIPKAYTQQLKGLAILCVLLIHSFAVLPTIYTSRPTNLFTFFVDQASRISVPLFLMVSGFGLSKSIEQKKQTFATVIKNRFVALVPLYLLWTAITILVLSFTPQWTYPAWPPPLWEQVLLGHADYHLYFVPIILQCYLLFPLLYKTIRAVPNSILFFFAIQLGTFYYFTQHSFTDGFEYTILTSWIGYFALGIWLSSNELSKKITKHLAKWTILGLVLVTLYSWLQTLHGLDPLFALKFTRFPLLLFTLPACLMFFANKPTLPSFFTLLGKYSFLLYLSHTLSLRIVYAYTHTQLSQTHLLLIVGIWGVTVLVTYSLTNRKLS